MRSFVTVSLLALTLAGTARAQSASEPSLIFSITGGLTTGQRLWSISNQRMPAVGTSEMDSLQLARRLQPGLVASLGVSFFRNRHFGLNAEVAYFGIGSRQSCLGPATYKTPADTTGGPVGPTQNQIGCETANNRNVGTSVIGFMGGVIYQLGDSATFRPYFRANAGLGLLAASYVETNGSIGCQGGAACPYPLLLEKSTHAMTWLVSMSAGIAVDLGPGYRVRMEGRDLMIALPRVTGPATPGPTGNVATTRSVLKHVPMFMIGFDVMLERRRARRY